MQTSGDHSHKSCKSDAANPLHSYSGWERCHGTERCTSELAPTLSTPLPAPQSPSVEGHKALAGGRYLQAQGLLHRKGEIGNTHRGACRKVLELLLPLCSSCTKEMCYLSAGQGKMSQAASVLIAGTVQQGCFLKVPTGPFEPSQLLPVYFIGPLAGSTVRDCGPDPGGN